MNGITLPANIESARTAAESATAKYGEMAGGQYTVGDILKQKAIDAYKASQDIIKPLDVATQEYLTAPQVAREKYQDIFNPFSREKLVSQFTGTQALPMLSLASILGQRFGRMEDIVGTGTRAYQAQTTAAQRAAELARQHYTDLLSEYQMFAPKEPGLMTLGEGSTIFDPVTGQPVYTAPKTYKGETVDPLQQALNLRIAEALGIIPGQGDYGEKPNFSPGGGIGTRVANDQGVVWEFDGSDWKPVGRL